MSGNKPFLVKGIQSVDDAKKAVLLGVDGIICKWMKDEHHPRCLTVHIFPVFQAATTQADKLMELVSRWKCCDVRVADARMSRGYLIVGSLDVLPDVSNCACPRRSLLKEADYISP